jgi:chemotaxis protein CheY-P-specific phosphatase CheC
MHSLPFTEDERDQLGEIVNIAMGRSGAALAEAFDGFVNLRVPEISQVEMADLDAARQRLSSAYPRISILHQEYLGELAGTIAVIYGPASYAALRAVLGFDERDGDGQRQREELLLELGNALAGTFVLEFGALLGMRTGMRPPRIAAFDLPVLEGVQHLFGGMAEWSRETMLIDIVFHLEGHDLPFELMVTVMPQCVPVVRRALTSTL